MSLISDRRRARGTKKFRFAAFPSPAGTAQTAAAGLLDVAATTEQQPATDSPVRGAGSAPETSWRVLAARHRAAAVAADALLTAVIVATLTITHTSSPGMLALVALAAVGVPLIVAARHGYTMTGTSLWRRHARIMLEILAALAVATMVAGYLGADAIPSQAILEIAVLTALATTAARAAQQLIVRNERSRGRYLRRTLLVGPSEHFGSMLDDPREARDHGMDVVGVCTSDAGADHPWVPIFGDTSAAPMLVDELDVDVVLVCSDGMTSAEVRWLCWQLERSPVELMMTAKLTEVVASRVQLTSMGHTPVVQVSLRPPSRQRWSKVAFDRTVGMLLLILAAPIIASSCIAVRLSSPGPTIFRQTRVTTGGAAFTMYKLRTMHLDAEERLADLLEHSDGHGLLFKLHDDPRITPAGRWLRRASLDELPQLWNVVRGDMSLVGPRPALPSEVAQYDEVTRQRLRVKPGVTGLWQVSGRSDLTAEQSIRLDLRYSDNWSIGMDLAILWRTGRAVLGGRGAY